MDLNEEIETGTLSLRLGTIHAGLLVVRGIADQNFSMSFDLSGVAGDLDSFGPSSENVQAAFASALGGNPLPVLQDFFADGRFATRVEFLHRPCAMQFDFNGSNEYARAQVSSESGRATFKLDPEAFACDVTTKKTANIAELNMPDIGHFILGMSIAEFGYGLSIGIGDLVTPQEIALTTRLVDLALSSENLSPD